MLAAPSPEPVRESQEVLLVDCVEHLHHRPLDDLVLQRSDPERPQPPIGLWDPHPTNRHRPERAAVHPRVQILQIALQVLSVLVPRDPVHPGSRARAQGPIRRLQALHGHVMQQRGEPHCPIARFRTHASQVR